MRLIAIIFPSPLLFLVFAVSHLPFSRSRVCDRLPTPTVPDRSSCSAPNKTGGNGLANSQAIILPHCGQLTIGCFMIIRSKHNRSDMTSRDLPDDTCRFLFIHVGHMPIHGVISPRFYACYPDDLIYSTAVTPHRAESGKRSRKTLEVHPSSLI